MHNYDEVFNRRRAARSEIHERALRAALAVAFGAGCSTPVPSNNASTASAKADATTNAAPDAVASTDTVAADASPSADAQATAETATPGEVAAGADAAPKADATTAADAGTDAALAETKAADAVAADVVAAFDAVVDDVTGKPLCTGVTGADWQPCCDALGLWCNAKFSSPNDQQECLFGPNFDGSTGCTPWGPPSPAAMV